MKIRIVEHFTRTTFKEVPDNTDNQEILDLCQGPHCDSCLEWDVTEIINDETDEPIEVD